MNIRSTPCIAKTVWGASDKTHFSHAINVVLNIEKEFPFLDATDIFSCSVEDNEVLLDWKKGLQNTVGCSIDPLFLFNCNGLSFEITLYKTKALRKNSKLKILTKKGVFIHNIPDLEKSINLLDKEGQKADMPISHVFTGNSIEFNSNSNIEIIKQTVLNGVFQEERVDKNTITFDSYYSQFEYLGYSVNSLIKNIEYELKIVVFGRFDKKDGRTLINLKTLEVDTPKLGYTPLLNIGVFYSAGIEENFLQKRIAAYRKKHQLDFYKVIA